MQTARVFQSEDFQEVRLPKNIHLHGDKVEVFERDGDIVLREIPQNLGRAFVLLTQFSDDFFEDGRKDTPPQKREDL